MQPDSNRHSNKPTPPIPFRAHGHFGGENRVLDHTRTRPSDAKSSLNVSLTPELEQFVESRVASGRYQTASEVIREGLRLLEEREQTREAALEELRAQLRRGVEQADRGELLDGDAVFEEIRQLSARRREETGK